MNAVASSDLLSSIQVSDNILLYFIYYFCKERLKLSFNFIRDTYDKTNNNKTLSLRKFLTESDMSNVFYSSANIVALKRNNIE